MDMCTAQQSRDASDSVEIYSRPRRSSSMQFILSMVTLLEGRAKYTVWIASSQISDRFVSHIQLDMADAVAQFIPHVFCFCETAFL
jgi:hypothetical protein